MKISFESKVVIITGCNGYLGTEFAKSFLNLGAEVIGLDKDKSTKFEDKNFQYYEINLENFKEIQKFYNVLKRKKTVPSILINNAGLSFKGSFKTRKQVEIQKMLSVNLVGLFNMITGFSNISAKGSNVLNISSIYGLISKTKIIFKK